MQREGRISRGWHGDEGPKRGKAIKEAVTATACNQSTQKRNLFDIIVVFSFTL